ncbi:hypothetical protein SPOG_01523 [Schizosaccharomyces cryophilus OY26]|uniref:Uncharacterized protein n=1 Tax=Schizosaccharomyces cryophilus (strain OY26 / ATCC MYA-4695 / CBS 11777 / NBRC 106824 / NRRL Y48691) TaxID=653667 RepID=S9WY32_SCHCR|nr:uncharacterized protein SPOG_01523 [Schizosaccharomyces cryophilus OY26]EPY49642.1 hypothetical protein SPOG_01523 [Schizosaccharomyces cryophilus OY26]
MSPPEEDFEETAPLTSEIPPQYEEEYNRRLWQSLLKRYNDLESLLRNGFLVLLTINWIPFILYLIWRYSGDVYESVYKGFAYLTIIPCLILGLACLFSIIGYLQPIVIEFEADSIPMQDLSRKGDTAKR